MRHFVLDRVIPHHMATPAQTDIDWTKKRVVIFDFDGTLVDIAEIFIDIINGLAPRYGYAPLRPDELPRLRDIGLRELLRTRVRLRFWQLWSFTRKAREAYRKRTRDIRLFPGIEALIEGLQRSGVRVGILSSNTRALIAEVLQASGLTVDFIETSSLFGKSRTLDRTLSERGIDRASAVYVGDEVRDVEACRKSGLDILAVTWGLNSRDALRQAGASTVDSPAELFARLVPKHTPETTPSIASDNP